MFYSVAAESRVARLWQPGLGTDWRCDSSQTLRGKHLCSLLASIISFIYFLQWKTLLLYLACSCEAPLYTFPTLKKMYLIYNIYDFFLVFLLQFLFSFCLFFSLLLVFCSYCTNCIEMFVKWNVNIWRGLSWQFVIMWPVFTLLRINNSENICALNG